MKLFKKILPAFFVASALLFSANFTCNVVHAQDQTVETLPNASLTVLQAEKYVVKNKLYKPVTKLPAITENIGALNQVVASMVKAPKLNLVILDMWEAASEKDVKNGYPERLFHAIDTANSIPQKVGNDIITGSHEFVIVHNKNAKKSLGMGPLIYIKNTANGNIAKADLDAAKKSKKEFNKMEDFLTLPQISIAKNSREYSIAQMVFAAAEQNKAKAK